MRKYRIPERCKDSCVLLFYRLFSPFPLSKKQVCRHLEKNQLAWKKVLSEDCQEDRMEHQEKLTNFVYGSRYTADYNSCEVIAVYHALLALNRAGKTQSHPTRRAGGVWRKPKIFLTPPCALKKRVNSAQKKKYADSCDFPELLAYFERNGITCGGAFGTSPYALVRFFRAQGFPVMCLRYPEWKKICQTGSISKITGTNDTFLFMAYNDASSLRAMLHTMCVTKEPEGYRRHNDFSELKYYPTLQKAVESYQNGRSRAIFIMAVSSCFT